MNIPLIGKPGQPMFKNGSVTLQFNEGDMVLYLDGTWNGNRDALIKKLEKHPDTEPQMGLVLWAILSVTRQNERGV
mgnify:FL=1